MYQSMVEWWKYVKISHVKAGNYERDRGAIKEIVMMILAVIANRDGELPWTTSIDHYSSY